MVSLMSNINKDVANRVIAFEHLNHLLNRLLYKIFAILSPDKGYPFALKDPRFEYKKAISR
jgi:hypothetical protein